VLAIIAVLVILNINKNNRTNKDDEAVKIVTSFYPMYIIAENITDGAENIELVNMADVNVGCLHDYTLTTEDMKKVENADIFIMNGLGMESFIEKILTSNQDMNIIDSSTEAQNVILSEDGVNAHIWTSIDNYILQVKYISKELINKNQENAEVYQKNTDEYVQKLEELKNEFETKLQNLDGKKAICLNEVFGYMGQELGMEMTTIATDHEESTMSADMLSSIIDKVKQENIQIIIIDKNDNKANAETIANETGAKILELNSGMTGELDKDAYINQIRENLNVLEKSI
jgi:zinc transport system substrate-binding protein